MQNNSYPIIPFDMAEQFMVDVFKKVGVPEQDAQICAEVLITSDKRGIESHGVGRFKTIYIDRIWNGQLKPTTKMDIVRESPTTAVIDGNHGMGHVISKKSMDLAMKKAKEYGMGMVAVTNSSHYGIAGYYALMAAEADMIGITGTNARPSVAPTFGVQNMLGTNPLTFGLPTDEAFPFILDCATSICQRGKVETYARQGKAIPEGWVINKDGSSCSDPQKILEALTKGDASLLPLGGAGEELSGYKGYGYSAVVEILSAALQGGRFMTALTGKNEKGELIPYGLGHFFIAMDINAFTDPADFKKIAGNILRDLRGSTKAPGENRIYTAGEKEYLIWQEIKDKGVKIDPVIQKEWKELNDKYNLNYNFPF